MNTIHNFRPDRNKYVEINERLVVGAPNTMRDKFGETYQEF